MKFNFVSLALALFVNAASIAQTQSVTIKEELRSLDTYGFDKPNPLPILTENPKIFPYFKFEEYDHKAKKKDWKVVTLENDYIKVMVLPEIGGKVWGAIEKSTGKEFLYKNEVVKFRNIAMRGPWTSGGIEFNFGIIGHHPHTATPVDYLTKRNDDGSVSCIVGAVDLPSNTYWQVEIRLERDKAYFETNALWYNASPLTQSYYNWMTGAAEATDDLEFYIPGNAYVEHNGNAHAWPIDNEGRDLSLYRNNNFGPAKSYHIVGEFNDFFGGYYRDSRFGFGQWAPYEEMPGQKLWLWALSRSGGIWEDLLTDTDGQYIEFQAGRLFDQYFPGAVNPISQVGFDPYTTDTWSEIWFPYKQIGGMVDASPHGVLNVQHGKDKLYIGINPLQNLDQVLKVGINDKIVLEEKLALGPMEIFTRELDAGPDDKVQITIAGTELSYTSDPKANELKRPFDTDPKIRLSKTEELLFEGTEALEYREFDKAHKLLSELVGLDPYHQAGLVQLAELEYRRANYDTALAHARTVLKWDTYNSGANYMAGLAYRAQNDTINALESLGWAARDVKYRSVAYAQMAELYLASKNYNRAQTYAQKAMDFNTYNLNARKVKLLALRKTGNSEGFERELDELLNMAPLSHFANLERQFMSSHTPDLALHNEFPSETLLGLALEYRKLGLVEEALQVLDLRPEATKNAIWSAYLRDGNENFGSAEALRALSQAPIEFVLPYRRETLPVLEWAVAQTGHWKFRYYLALNYYAVGRNKEGEALLQGLGSTPDSDVFYRFRAKMLKDRPIAEVEADYEKALELKPKDWKVWEENILFYLDHQQFDQAYKRSKRAYKKFLDNYNIGLAHAKALLNTGRYTEVLSVLEKIEVLPYEHASESREIYERAHLALAVKKMKSKAYDKAIALLNKAKEWPENIGVGKPYGPDERAQDYQLALASKYIGETEKNLSLLEQIARYTQMHPERNSINHLYGLLALRQLNRDKEADLLLTKLKSNTDDGHFKTRLAVALFENDKGELETIKTKHKIPNDVIEVAQWAVSQ
ncbi:DUF5107 domain-containing protein [Pseudozobellia thermophila]|uniref:Tetratricopeptide repeat-containing protein n=1 Tax=Pseudozobellia thermophila TaxID=192903 RepID=A0A1M6LGW6_9FLAO|nr:DUF5107 domain-containing protein [Pseudozobellia thermophila]SHJ70453.1 hypothetical protein SAMN04488513_107156 [Pseudozobellia thermophila]